MDDLRKVDEERFVAEVMARVRGRVAEVIQAVNQARTGHLIDDSEGPVLAIMGELGRDLYQAAIQSRVDATEAAASFSPSGCVGAGVGGSRPAQPLGTDAAGSGGVDAAAVLEPGRGFAGAGGRPGGPDRGHPQRRRP